MPGDARDDGLDDVLDGLRAFLRAEVIARHLSKPELADPKQQFGPDGRYRPEVLAEITRIRTASAAAGFYTMLTPADLGGGGMGFEALFRVWETVFRECGSLHWLGHWAVAHWSRGPSLVLAQATPTVRERVLPALLAGETSMCFAMSEPDAGSDAWMMRTSAERVDGGWKLSGTKQWVTNGPYADHAVVFAVVDRDEARERAGGIGAFLIPTDTPGFRIDSVIEMFGHAGGDEAIISLNDVVVPDDHVLGPIGDGMRVAMAGVSSGRLYNAARSVGLARWAIAQSVAYAQERVAFRRPIIEHQAVSHRLADAAIEINAARLVGLDCAQRLDRGEPSRHTLAMTKVFTTEVAVRAIDSAVQVHGALGLTNDLGLAEAWQQVRRVRIADGTAEILREQVVKGLRSGDLVV